MAQTWIAEVNAPEILRGDGTDKISLPLDEPLARAIHGPYWEHWQGASLRLEVAPGRAEQALAEMGFDEAVLLDIRDETPKWDEIKLPDSTMDDG